MSIFLQERSQDIKDLKKRKAYVNLRWNSSRNGWRLEERDQEEIFGALLEGIRQREEQ